MIVGAANLGGGVRVVVHREDSPGVGVPITAMNPGSEDYPGRPRRMAGPFAAISRGRSGCGYTGGWKSFDLAIGTIRAAALLNEAREGGTPFVRRPVNSRDLDDLRRRGRP